jgi:hypothetical protein
MTLAFAQFGRIFAALGAGRYADAYEAAQRLFDPASQAHHPVVACWIIGDLAEAALRTDRVDEARARVKQVEAVSSDTPGTCIAVGLRHARALLAHDPAKAADRFDEALGADLTGWPLHRGRLLLATASGCAASVGSPTPGHRCGTPATSSTPWAAPPGAIRPAGNCGRPENPAADAASPRATS